MDSKATVIDAAATVAPSISGTTAGQTTAAETTIPPFQGVTIGDTNAGATDTLTISLSGTGGGTLTDGTTFSGLTHNQDGSYTLKTDTALNVTNELDALVFKPTAGAPGSQTTTTFTLSDKSSAYSTAAVDSKATVIDAAATVASNGGGSGGGGGGGGGSTSIPVIAPPIVNPTTNNTPSTLLPGPSLSFNPTVSVLGQTVTMTLTALAQAGVSSVHVFEGTTDIGTAALNDDGSWSFAFSNGPGFHTDLTAVVTDNQGLQASAPSYYDLTTGVRGQPYKVEQDSYDPSSYAYEGSTYFKRSGAVYLQSAYTALPEGGATYTYTAGTFFDDKVYTSFADTYDTEGNLKQHVENNADGSHYFDIEGDDQTVRALGSDVFSDNAISTRFVFGHQDGQETIYGFQSAGAGHDTLSMVHTDAAALANILASGRNDNTGSAVLNFGHGTVVTLDGVDIAEVHLKDFLKHA